MTTYDQLQADAADARQAALNKGLVMTPLERTRKHPAGTVDGQGEFLQRAA